MLLCITVSFPFTPQLNQKFWEWQDGGWGGSTLRDRATKPASTSAKKAAEKVRGRGGRQSRPVIVAWKHEGDWNFSRSRQVSAGIERRENQRRDHVEPVCTGYEVRDGRSVNLSIRYRVCVCVCASLMERKNQIKELNRMNVGLECIVSTN